MTSDTSTYDAGSIHPSPDQMQEFARHLDDDQPIVMVNLLRFRDRAAYPPGVTAAPCSGREAYTRYASVAVRTIAEVGGGVVWQSPATYTLIGPPGEWWDEVILVRYPSRRAFLEMVALPQYVEASVHRTAALEDSRLIATVGGPPIVPA